MYIIEVKRCFYSRVGVWLNRIILGVQYDGSSWKGWQTQPSGQTVQDKLESALQQFTQKKISITSAGRTDSGVHALEQIVHFDTALSRENFSWVRGLNSFLPSSIAVRWSHKLTVPADSIEDSMDFFHARFSAICRTYYYFLYTDPVRSPILEGKAGWVFKSLTLEQMRRAALPLIGTQDFSAFRAAECQARSPIRTMEEICIDQYDNLFTFKFRANSFLHHMIRNIVSSLVYVGSGKKEPEWIVDLIKKRDRSYAAPTFMPDGLYLAQIAYDAKWQLPQQSSAPFYFLNCLV
jgi:tRNA pseudouridine38-40 synthase